ncbi:MAG: hypothetical protein EOP78_14210 [Variovorax sp.]|nr:MAG: hypothetical protein EOP78_14210 [Variovorax sp.]
MTMRIAKYPALPSFGRDFHNVLPGSLPPVPPSPVNPAPLPMYLWTALMVNYASPEIFGKFTRSNSITEGMGDILAGHDWGMMQPHIPIPPVVMAPNALIVAMGSSHKYFLPSYAVQETPQGGALAMAGASGSAVAVTTSAFVIPLQDCIEGFVAPLGVGIQLASVRWVGFGACDVLAGVISFAADGLGAVVSGGLGNSMSNGLGLSAMGGAVLGAVLNSVNAAVQNFANANLPGGVVGTAAGYLPCAAMIVLGPAAIGLAGGRIADAAGGAGYATPGEADSTGVQIVPGATGL